MQVISGIRIRVGVCLCAVAAAIAVSGPVRADGEFYQFDYAARGSSAVASIQRGSYGVALGWSEWEDGQAVSLFLSRGWPVPQLGQGTTIRLGPSFRQGRGRQRDLGVRATLEHFRPTSWGSFFGLADLNSIKREYLVLAEFSHWETGLAGFASLQGDNDGFHERTLGVSVRLGESPVRLRLGHRFRAGTTFLGLSINTF